MADNSINILSDALLKQTPSELDRLLLSNPAAPVAHSTLTVADLKKALGADYTSLVEQIVPGEFWVGTDGQPKQVYQRTFTGTTPTTSGGEFVSKSTKATAIKIIMIRIIDTNSESGNTYYWNDSSVATRPFDVYSSLNNGIVFAGFSSASVQNNPYVMTLKYCY